MEQALKEIINFCQASGCAYLEQEPMAAHTSLKIGGPVELFVRPDRVQQAAGLLQKAKELQVPILFIGKGSNLLAPDEGLKGIALCFDERAAKPALIGENEIECPAGASLSALCIFVQRHGLSGLEFAYGIPGSVGGAVYMNAGAYGGEMKDVVKEAVYLDENGKAHRLDTGALAFGYRKSCFSAGMGGLICSARFQLQKGDPQEILARMEELMERRKSKQPLEYPSAGSTFKRPEGAFAAALIDECGLKGRRVGGAMVSEKHAGFLINYDRATCKDMLGLIGLVQREVLEKTGFRLKCEVRIL